MPANKKQRVLIVDDDVSVQVSLALLLKQSGFDAISCDDPREALALLQRTSVDLVLQDMNFSLKTTGEEGLGLLSSIKALCPAVPVLLMTAWGSITLAVRGVKAGAADFFTKPWNNAQLVQLINTTLELAHPAAASRPDRQSLDELCDFSGIVGEHPELLKVLSTVARVAKTRAAVLILGESGTGKELIADALHRNSPRASKTAIKVNMGAITPSLFESEMFGHVKGAFTDAKSDRKGYFASAQGSTLFLDEIGELNKADQVKLLRVLEGQTYQPVGASHAEQADVRLVSATNQELAERVACGEFREDLFYRLNLITLRLPPLRERRSDIPLLATRLLADMTASYELGEVALSPAALEWLSNQAWPGNIRQLRQTLERALLLTGKALLEPVDFADGDARDGVAGAAGRVDGMTLDQAERHMVEKALELHDGNISRAARALGLSRASLYRRLEKHGLSSSDESTET